MPLFHRLCNLNMSNVYAAIETCEDPVKMADHFILCMTDDIRDTQQILASQFEEEKKYNTRYEQQISLVEKYQEQAITAAKVQNSNMVRRALQDKARAVQKRDLYKYGLDQSSSTVALLLFELMDMREHLNEMNTKRETLVAQYLDVEKEAGTNQAMPITNPDSGVTGKQLNVKEEAGIEIQITSGLSSVDKDIEIEHEFVKLMEQYALANDGDNIGRSNA